MLDLEDVIKSMHRGSRLLLFIANDDLENKIIWYLHEEGSVQKTISFPQKGFSQTDRKHFIKIG
jgi:hypothetical protein